MTTRTSPSSNRRALASAVAAVHVGGLAALAVYGTMLWRSYCEGFGCIGTGIAWFAWTIGYAVTLLAGVVAVRSYSGPGRALLRYGLALQGAAGVMLTLYWAWRAA